MEELRNRQVTQGRVLGAGHYLVRSFTVDGAQEEHMHEESGAFIYFI